jgi:hypothetical protein
MPLILLIFGLLPAGLLAQTGFEGESRLLPADFLDGRIYLNGETTDGERLTFFLDTAGPTLIYSDAVDRINQEPQHRLMQGQRLRLDSAT